MLFLTGNSNPDEFVPNVLQMMVVWFGAVVFIFADSYLFVCVFFLPGAVKGLASNYILERYIGMMEISRKRG